MCACVCARTRVHRCSCLVCRLVQISSRGAEQSRRNESSLDSNHRQACTFDFFLVLSLSRSLFPRTLMAACLKAAAVSYRVLFTPGYTFFLHLFIWLPWTLSIGPAFYSFFFSIIFSLLNFEDSGFGGHVFFSYCNLLYVVLFFFFSSRSKLTQDVCARGCVSKSRTSDYF